MPLLPSVQRFRRGSACHDSWTSTREIGRGDVCRVHQHTIGFEVVEGERGERHLGTRRGRQRGELASGAGRIAGVAVEQGVAPGRVLVVQGGRQELERAQEADVLDDRRYLFQKAGLGAD